MGPRRFQGNRVVGEILFHLATSHPRGSWEDDFLFPGVIC